jgi:hypothetical protein
MQDGHSKPTIVSMAVVAAGLAVLLHEGVGHGVTAWLRGDIPTELTSNHLSSIRSDKWVEAGGTLVNLVVGAVALTAAQVGGDRASLRYFWWILAAHNLFAGAGYFMYSGVFDFGDWAEVIRGLPHHGAWRVGMTLFGAVLYLMIARLLAVEIRPFVWRRGMYNVVGRLPYLAGCALNCAAGSLDPMGLQLMLVSTIPAAFGGTSGLLWLDSLMPRTPVEHELVVRRQPVWWVLAAVSAVAYIAILGPGIKLPH